MVGRHKAVIGKCVFRYSCLYLKVKIVFHAQTIYVWFNLYTSGFVVNYKLLYYLVLTTHISQYHRNQPKILT